MFSFFSRKTKQEIFPFHLLKIFLLFDKMASWKNDLAPFVDIYGFNLTPATSPRDIVFSLLKTFLLLDKIASWQNLNFSLMSMDKTKNSQGKAGKKYFFLHFIYFQIEKKTFL